MVGIVMNTKFITRLLIVALTLIVVIVININYFYLAYYYHSNVDDYAKAHWYEGKIAYVGNNTQLVLIGQEFRRTDCLLMETTTHYSLYLDKYNNIFYYIQNGKIMGIQNKEGNIATGPIVWNNIYPIHKIIPKYSNYSTEYYRILPPLYPDSPPEGEYYIVSLPTYTVILYRNSGLHFSRNRRIVTFGVYDTKIRNYIPIVNELRKTR
jgi:hypothetical protein